MSALLAVSHRWKAVVFACLVLLVQAVCASRALAGGPRFMAGQGWGVPATYNAAWQTGTLLYYTDQGSLSPNVPKAQADAMVEAAAAVWNVPTSSIALVHGGTLAEDVNVGNITFSNNSVVFPPDMQLSNEGNVPLAIAYDVDGSLIDALLGQDASEPDGCAENAVVGDVDDIHQNDGSIRHATLILNGRCVGSTPEQMTQMQYQLARAFGRVLGLSWSQTNDNVFTAQTAVTAQQLAFWPLMHPIDVICGNYTYQCMTDPFTLRVDDLNTLAQVYPVFQSTARGNQVDSIADALWLWGILYFPTGQGMGWVNVTTRRQHNGLNEDWQTVSGITGSLYEQASGTPVDSQPAVNSGSATNGLDGYFSFRRVPLDGLSNVFVTTEPINPLYMGDAAIGPYVRPPVLPSGSPATNVEWSALPNGDQSVSTFMGSSDAASSCNPGNDGTETAPAGLDPSGWQNGQLCGWGHSSWFTVAAAAGHSWTLEVTATDETGAANLNKAQPVMGVWNAGDPAGTAPTVASEAAPFNSMAMGVTQIQMGGGGADGTYRFSVTDQYGAGRPDFTYVARVLYAASVSPMTVGSDGGQIVVTGSGFRQGNEVLVNGAPARVVSWSGTQIVADAPSMSDAGAATGVPVVITVLDTDTNGSATIPSGFNYVPAPDVLQQVSAPAALETGLTAGVPFAVRVMTSDGLSPLANAAVSLAVTGGGAGLGLCGGGASCTGTTDGNGLVQTTVTGEAAGAATISAMELSGGATLQVTILDVDPVRSATVLDPVHYVAAGASGTWTVQLNAVQDGLAAVGVPVSWSSTGGLVLQGGAAAMGADGTARQVVTAGNVAAGSVSTVTACVWSTVCVSWTMNGVDPSQWTVHAPASVVGSVPVGTPLSPVVMTVTDLAGHALEETPVQVYQRVLGYEGACGTAGRCPAAPVLATSQATVSSDANGSITVTPLAAGNAPQVLEIAVSSGTTGFATMTLTRTP